MLALSDGVKSRSLKNAAPYYMGLAEVKIKEAKHVFVKN